MRNLIKSNISISFRIVYGLFTLFFIFRSFSVLGGIPPMGARSAGLGNTNTCLTGLSAAFHNPAGLAVLKHTTAGSYYGIPFLLADLQIQSLAFHIPVHNESIGIHYLQYGNISYREIKSGIIYSKKITPVLHAGINLYYHRIQIAGEYGHGGYPSFSLGMIFQLNKKINLGVFVADAFADKNKLIDYAAHPSAIIKLGIKYTHLDNLTIYADVEKRMDTEIRLGLGVEYFLNKRISVLAGLNSQGHQACFGFGIPFGNMHFLCAATIHTKLGSSVYSNFEYAFKDRK